MNVTDPVGDMLARIKNGIHRGAESVDIPASKIKQGICEKLLDQGYITDFKVIRNPRQGTLRVYIKYDDEGEAVISDLERKSKPSRRVYLKVDEIPVVKSGLGNALLTTPEGVLTGREAREHNVGGEFLCEVW
ncbi:MAG: 30S ribosomal protein S8 [bacterium]